MEPLRDAKLFPITHYSSPITIFLPYQKFEMVVVIDQRAMGKAALFEERIEKAGFTKMNYPQLLARQELRRLLQHLFQRLGSLQPAHVEQQLFRQITEPLGACR